MQEVLTREAAHAAHVARRVRMRSFTPRAALPPPASAVAAPPEPVDYHVERQHNDHVLRYWRRWRPRHADVSVESVIRACAAHYGVTVEDLVGRGQHELPTRARHAAAYLVRSMTTHGLLAVARRLNRHHTSVMHSCQKVGQLVADGEMPEVETIRRALLAERDLTPVGG